MDDHQIEIVRQFGDMGLIEPCMDPTDLPAAYARVLSKDYLPYKEQRGAVLRRPFDYIDGVGGVRMMKLKKRFALSLRNNLRFYPRRGFYSHVLQSKAAL